MDFENTTLLDVSFDDGSEIISVGQLSFKDRKILFEYAPSFIKTGIELSPFKLPLKAGVYTNEDPVFDGLFGVFNDGLPDGWGRLLLDRKLLNMGVNAQALSPLDRLRYVGAQGMGALIYSPIIEAPPMPSFDDLDHIANEAQDFQENDTDHFVDDLLAMSGSSAGARPKILVTIEKEDWLIKFPSSMDPKDIGAIEYAYHLMAQSAKLDVPTAKLFPSKSGLGYFGVKRFDRHLGKRVHMHTMSGLLHADHHLPSLDYETIMKTTGWLTKNQKDCEKQFRAAVFNVLSHNRDDHAKNFSFLMDGNGSWKVSPAYDLTFSSGPAGEHSSMIMGEGKNPSIQQLLQLAAVGNIKENDAKAIIDEVAEAVSQWKTFAEAANVTPKMARLIQSTVNNINKKCFKES